MITVVDRGNGYVTQKVSHNGKLIRYQVIAEDKIGDSEAVTVSSTLTAARAIMGKTNGGKATQPSA